MRLRSRTILWLLPVTLPLLLHGLLQFRAETRALETSMRHAATLATTGAADEFNGLLWVAVNAFDALSRQLGSCESEVMLGDEISPRVDAALRANPHFSLLALVDNDGKVTVARAAPINSNRHILPRDITGEPLLDGESLNRLNQGYAFWRGELSRRASQQRERQHELETLAATGQFNSERYRLLQHQNAQLSMVMERGPRDVIFGAGDLAARAGLPFRADTFLFAAVRRPCGEEPLGYLVAMLDWTQVEDILFKYSARLRSGGVDAGEVMLVNHVTGEPLSAPIRTDIHTLRDHLAQEMPPRASSESDGSEGNAGGLLVAARAADDGVLRRLDGLLSRGEPVTHGRYRALAEAQSEFSVVAFVPADAPRAITDASLTRFLLWSAMSLALLLGLIWLLAKGIVNPITKLARTMENAAQGDLQVRAQAERDDEIGDLGRVFNSMISALQRRRAELEEHASLLGATLESTSDGILVIDRDGNARLSNARFAELWRIPAPLLEAGDDARMLAHVTGQLQHPDKFIEGVQALYADPEATSEDVLLFKDGRVYERFSLPQRIDGETVGRVWNFRDVTRRVRAEMELRLTAAVFTHAGEGILITDHAGKILEVNDSFLRLTGYGRDEVVGQRPGMLRSGCHDETFYAALRAALRDEGSWSGEIWNRRKNGEIHPVQLTISAVPGDDGQPTHFVALYTDISAHKKHERQLEQIAHRDPLTGLPNRTLLSKCLQQAMEQAHSQACWLGLMYLDLDGFKQINDSWGHDTGDRVLMLLAKRMQACLREGDTVARLGGDEFAVVLLNLKCPAQADPVLDQLLSSLAEPAHIDGRLLQVSASIGLALLPPDQAVDGDQLLRQADQAMYEAKVAGKNRYRVFDSARDLDTKSRFADLERVRHALDADQFVLHYQPIVNMRNGHIAGAEALLRWPTREHGLMTPGSFLPALANDPMSAELDLWVLQRVLRQLDGWCRNGLRLSLSINIGARLLQQADFPDRLRDALATYPDLDPGLVELEVVESNALEDIGQVSAVMAACCALGVSFAIDDFGTGYSSLTYLRRLPASYLKIDRSFVRDMLEDPGDLAILEGVMGLAAAFQARPIAEGVECIAQGELLLRLGCELAQGYAIARPMPADQIPNWVAAWRTDPSWEGRAPLAREHLSLLFASVQLQAALKSLEKGQVDETRAMDLSRTEFGQWLAGPGRERYQDFPGFGELAPLYRGAFELVASKGAAGNLAGGGESEAIESQIQATAEALGRAMMKLIDHCDRA